MELSTQIIEVLDNLSDRLGIAIDWTQQNILSQVMDICIRYRQYEIYSILIGLCVCVVLFVISCFCIYKLYNSYQTCIKTSKNTSLFCYWSKDTVEFNVQGTILAIIAALTCIGTFTIILCEIPELIKWIYIPEIQFIDTIKSIN